MASATMAPPCSIPSRLGWYGVIKPGHRLRFTVQGFDGPYLLG